MLHLFELGIHELYHQSPLEDYFALFDIPYKDQVRLVPLSLWTLVEHRIWLVLLLLIENRTNEKWFPEHDFGHYRKHFEMLPLLWLCLYLLFLQSQCIP